MTEPLLPLLAVIIPIYWLWRRQSALKARIKVMKEIDSFLNPEKGNHEISKEIVFHAYEDSKNHFFIFELMALSIFKRDEAGLNRTKEVFSFISKEEKTKMFGLLIKILLTNIKLSPLSYLLFGFVFVIVAINIALFNQLSPRKIQKTLKSWKEKTLYSIYSY